MNKLDKLHVAVLAGGRSGEHEVSLQSARNVVAGLDRDRYEVSVVGIDKLGAWWYLPEDGFLVNAEDPKRIALADGAEVAPPSRPGPWILTENRTPVDVVFPVLHGTFCEDGTLQGLLELAEIAYVGADVLGSSLAMDKDAAKRMLRGSGIAVVDWVCVYDKKGQWGLDEIIGRLGLPLFVKPANLGSSVGIAKVKSADELQTALVDAFQYDTKVLVEKALDVREIEVSVLGNEEMSASVPGEVVPRHEFYSYDAKYIDDEGAALVIPADLEQETIRKVQTLAIQAFASLECCGMARVDFFLEKSTGKLFFNELNTLPGFTRISMYPKLWEASGLPLSHLLQNLIGLAVERWKSRVGLKRSYDL